MRRLFAALGLFCCIAAFAAEVIPPTPKLYFNDGANVVSPQVALHLNEVLADFERSNSSQIVVAVYPKMQSDSSIEDYTVRVAQSWKVGQADKKNGAVLFVFTTDHKMFLQVGYGLEGALPDALCKQIIDREIAPRFKAGDYEGGLTAGVNAIMSAVKGEYKGAGHTANDLVQDGVSLKAILILVVILIILIFMIRTFGFGFVAGMLFNGSGYSSRSGGGGWSSGGGGGGSSGFSGGGGSFGGGGAGGSW